MAANLRGPTARVKQFAAAQPGSIISWREARDAYGTGVTKNWKGDYVPSAANHTMSVSNVLHRHFVKVEGSGSRGLHVLLTSMDNHDVEEDRAAMEEFHREYGCDEFGRSTYPRPDWLGRALQPSPIPRLSNLFRMSDICSDDL